MFKTRNPHLEQFLYAHRIRFTEHVRVWDSDAGRFLTEWIYCRTPELERVVEEFKAICNRRKAVA